MSKAVDKGPCPILKIGKSDRWRESFYKGYMHQQTIFLTQGIVINEVDELLKYPYSVRYFECDYKEQLKKQGACADHAECKGIAVAKWAAWLRREE